MKYQKTYSIGEASTITGISKRQLRNWEGKYIPHQIRITVGDRHFRRYTSEDIRLIKKIKKNLDDGFTLSAAAKIAAKSKKAQKETINE